MAEPEPRKAVRCRYQKVISVEPAKQKDTEAPLVIVSFGDIEGPVVDFAIEANCARLLVVQTLCALATHGDETAKTILNNYFLPEEE